MVFSQPRRSRLGSHWPPNKLATTNFKVWKPGSTNTNAIRKTEITNNNHLPFLEDMELCWCQADELSFCVHMKLNQQIKYLTEGSSHMLDCCINAILTKVSATVYSQN